MSQEAQRAFEDVTCVDADVHLDCRNRPERLVEHLEEPYVSRLMNDAVDVSSQSVFLTDGWERTVGGKIDTGPERSGTPEQLQGTVCEEFGVDYPVINPGSSLERIGSSDFAAAMMRAYNDVMIEDFLEEYDHFRGLAALATQRPHLAAEEIDRLAGEDQVVGIYLATGMPPKPLGDRYFDPIYEAANDHGLPVAYHGSTSPFAVSFSKHYEGFESMLETHTLSHPFAQMVTLTSLVFEGVPEKFPNVDFLFLEAGLGWVPYMMARMNMNYSKRRSEAPLLEKAPEEYLRERFYFAAHPVGEFVSDPEHTTRILEILGPDMVVFATDYPHWDFDHPEAFDAHIRRAFTAEERERVLGGNAAELFDLPV